MRIWLFILDSCAICMEAEAAYWTLAVLTTKPLLENSNMYHFHDPQDGASGWLKPLPESTKRAVDRISRHRMSLSKAIWEKWSEVNKESSTQISRRLWEELNSSLWDELYVQIQEQIMTVANLCQLDWVE